jgi:hypothetical protein
MTKQASSLELFVAAEKVARHTEEWNATTVIERVRESDHATDDDIITFAETFVDGPYREKEEGASFAHLFERMLREGPGIIDEQLEAVEHERKRRREGAARAAKDFRGRGPEFDDLLRMLLGEDFFDDDTKSTASRKLYSTQSDKGRPKGYASWNPHRKTKVIIAQVEKILEEY